MKHNVEITFIDLDITILISKRKKEKKKHSEVQNNYNLFFKNKV